MKFNGFVIKKEECIIEIGGGDGSLALSFINSDYKIVEYIEPDISAFSLAEKKLKGKVPILSRTTIKNININKFTERHKKITFILQDVIEHITLKELRDFLIELSLRGCEFKIIGRTPNVASLYGLRNAFGDSTHIYYFTERTLREHLKKIGFQVINAKSEPYKVTGLVSAFRMVPYFLVLGLLSLSFICVFGSFEGLFAPNLVFEASYFKAPKGK